MEKQELFLDGDISIIIGPNGGGKTNLLDTVVTCLRRHLFASSYPAAVPQIPGEEIQYEFRFNDVLNQLQMEKHSATPNAPQEIELEIEVTQTDLNNMTAMKNDSIRLTELGSRKYRNLTLNQATAWDLTNLPIGKRVKFRIQENNLTTDGDAGGNVFLQYLRLYEMDGRVREDYKFAQLSLPVLYLPVNRAANGFQSNIGLAGFNEFETKRSLDVTSSRSGGNYVALAIGRLAQKYRLLLEDDKGRASADFALDPNIEQLTKILRGLGYEWKLETINPMTNEYNIRLTKQGASFLVNAASSGERELLTYLFVIFGLNIRDALVVVDEPELHLHPKWQRALLSIFVELAKLTGNQFLIATHSPTFISPDSIQYVSRVSSVAQRSKIQRLKNEALPEAKHLLNIINSQNNERLFFADAVVLVEGISDRIVFQKILDLRSQERSAKPIIEVVEVGGKGFFGAYKKLLDACQIPFSIIADRDYIEQVGDAHMKSLFRVNAKEIREDVLENVKSIDASTMVAAIDSALQSGNFETAKDIWEYIKSRRRELRKDLDDAERKQLQDFLNSASLQGLHILQEGAIEAYLPNGFKNKSLDKVIELVASNNLWEQLLPDRKHELSGICDAIWDRHSATAPKIGASGDATGLPSQNT